MKFREVGEKTQKRVTAGLVAGAAYYSIWMALHRSLNKNFLTELVLDVPVPDFGSEEFFRIFEVVNGMINLLLSDGTFTDAVTAAQNIKLYDVTGLRRRMYEPGIFVDGTNFDSQNAILGTEVARVPELRDTVREASVQAAVQGLNLPHETKDSLLSLRGRTLTVRLDMRNTAKQIKKGLALVKFFAQYETQGPSSLFNNLAEKGKDVRVQQSFIGKALNWIGI